MSEEKKAMNYQIGSIKKQKAFAWFKYFEAKNDESQNANVIIRYVVDAGINRDERGQLERPEKLPQHITQEFFDMASRLNKEYTCPCCFELVNKDTIHITWCGHILCKECYESLKDNAPLSNGRKAKCPMCRKLI